ncbi:LamG-like jellyroll fold domain-containing protein [Aliikangiella maris]|uniref:LamG-like jellyroll fold domain-containing protein n=2 Tax=Aliikangiella maris TaxID=3162458 RepID=A0ABV2BUZ5_9GAMM
MRFSTRLTSLFSSILIVSLFACGGGGGGEEPPPVSNQPPTADAGADQTVNATATVSLSGTASDSDGSISSVGWSQVSGAMLEISNATTNSATVTLLAVSTDTDFVFRFTATDDNGATASDEVTITATPNHQALLGPIIEAQVSLYQVTDLENPIFSTTTNNIVDDLNQAGKFSLDLNSANDSDWLVVKIEGGRDIDADDDGTIDSMATPNTGAIYALATKADLKAGTKINLLTTLAYKAVEPKISAGQLDTLADDMQWAVTSLLGDDLNGDSELNYKDLLAFVPTNAEHLAVIAIDYSRFFETNTNNQSLISAIHNNLSAEFDERVSVLFPDGLSSPELPSKLMATPTFNIPANRGGITDNELTVSSLFSDQSEILDSAIPTLLAADTADGKTSLLAYALPATQVAKFTKSLSSKQSSRIAKMMTANAVEVSPQSTAFSLVYMTLGLTEQVEDYGLVASSILEHSKFAELTAAISNAYQADPLFLESVINYPYVVKLTKSISSEVLNQYLESLAPPAPKNHQIKKFATTAKKPDLGPVTPNGPTNDWWGPWSDEPWYLYNPLGSGVGDPPYLAAATETNSLLATGNPTMINYVVEMYDSNGEVIYWNLIPRNSTLVQKAKNLGAAQLKLYWGKELSQEVEHVRFSKNWLNNGSQNGAWLNKGLHIFHLTNAVVNIVIDASATKKIATKIEKLAKSKAMVETAANCGTYLVDTIKFVDGELGDFLAENGLSIAETGFNSCIIPFTKLAVGNAIEDYINSQIKSVFKSIAEKTSPYGWISLVIDSANELVPLGSSLIIADDVEGYNIDWTKEISETGFITQTDQVPQPDSPPIALPIAKFGFTKEAGLAIAFDSTASTFDDSATPSYDWNFGDGSTSSDANPSHTFAAAGDYTVSLTVDDGLGNTADFSLNIEVTNGFSPEITDIHCQLDVNNPLDVYIAIKGKDQDNDISHINWYLSASDQTPFLTENWISVNSATLTYPDDGIAEYSPMAVVVDAAGNQTGRVCESIVSNGSSDLQNGLFAYFPFDGNANDASGNGNHGTEVGTVLYGSGHNSESLDLSGQYVRVDGTGPYFDGSNEFSISIWVKPGTNSAYGTLISQRIMSGNDRNVQFGIWRNADNAPYLRVYGIDTQGVDTSASAYASTKLTNTSKWYHTAGVYDGSKVKIYVDGQLESSVDYSDEVRTIAGAYSLIGFNPTAQYWYGNIDELKLFDRALSGAEIRDLAGSITQFEDDFSGTLGAWTGYADSNWSIVSGELRGVYSLSCGSTTCAQADLILKDEFQPEGDWSASFDFIRVVDSSISDYYAAWASFSIRESPSSKLSLSLGGAGSNNWGGIQDNLKVSIQYLNGSWSSIVNDSITMTWDPDVWHKARLEKSGNIYSLYFDDIFVYQFVDTLLDGQGKVGLHTYGTKRYDNFLLH